jgi:hypothetical protein
MLASIFGSDAPRFTYNGDSKPGGRLLSDFWFRMLQERSRYMYVLGSGPSREVPMAYNGTAFVNPGTSDLVRLIIRTVRLRPKPGRASSAKFSTMAAWGSTAGNSYFPRRSRRLSSTPTGARRRTASGIPRAKSFTANPRCGLSKRRPG